MSFGIFARSGEKTIRGRISLRKDQIDFRTGTLHVRRVKQGTPSTHPIRRLQREQKPKSPFVFTSERGSPFTTAGFARMIERAGKVAKLAFKAHPHMLRHACGMRSRTEDTIHGHCRLTSATAISSTQCAIPSCRRRVSRISGGSELPHPRSLQHGGGACPSRGGICQKITRSSSAVSSLACSASGK
jgi:Phage integrase family